MNPYEDFSKMLITTNSRVVCKFNRKL